MAEAAGIALVLLGAGRSIRFGDADKLTASLGGKPLAAHAVAALAPIGFGCRLAVIAGQGGFDFAAHGYRLVEVTPGRPQSASLAAGIRQAAEAGCTACLVALADMPFIPTHHFRALLAAYRPPAMATLSGGQAMVPAILGSALWPQVTALSGDRGAGALIADAPGLSAEDDWLLDVDTPADLARAHALIMPSRQAFGVDSSAIPSSFRTNRR